MSNHSSPDYRERQIRAQLGVMLDALDGVSVSDTQRQVLTWLAGWEPYVCQAVADLFAACRHEGGGHHA